MNWKLIRIMTYFYITFGVVTFFVVSTFIKPVYKKSYADGYKDGLSYYKEQNLISISEYRKGFEVARKEVEGVK